MTLEQDCLETARRARAAGRALATAAPAAKNAFLQALARRLADSAGDIISANGSDVAEAEANRLSSAQVDRLRLNAGRIEAMRQGVLQIAALPEPVGRVIQSTVPPNGLRIDKVAVPLGTIFFLYESRPNVTVDAAALAVKSGNAIILRGGKEAARSNQALHAQIEAALADAGLPTDAVQLVRTTDRAAVGQLLQMPEYIDLVIPRGGRDLIERVARESRIPVLKHFQGICHVYVDVAADPAMARRIAVNAKCSRPGVCNAAECLLVHADASPAVFRPIIDDLLGQGVEIRGCPRTVELVPEAIPATDADFATEYLALKMSVRIVESMSEAIEHIRRFGTGHTEVIVTRDLAAARRFTAEVDAAAVFVNASSRFHDGGEFGLGAEIGISTDRFHARGPCGLQELTTYKYVVYGDGHVRT
jgi:glutamate-5-semialdehyde dehydrogenase